MFLITVLNDLTSVTLNDIQLLLKHKNSWCIKDCFLHSYDSNSFELLMDKNMTDFHPNYTLIPKQKLDKRKA